MLSYKPWLPLTTGSIVDIIAPSSGWSQGDIKQIQEVLAGWGLVARIPATIYGQDLLCANTDEQRFLQLQQALINPDSAAVWCLRGGYGATRLLPALLNLPIPASTKLFMGLSDITALHIFLQDWWGWQTLHAPSASQIASQSIHADDIACLQGWLFGKQNQLTLQLQPLNTVRSNTAMLAPITGGNLSLLQASVGTAWQINTANKILFLEEINERAYRIDRLLVHLAQVGLFSQLKAIIFGDFIGGLEPNGHSLILEVLMRFALQQNFPVYTCTGIGHGFRNTPLPLGALATIDEQHYVLQTYTNL